MMSFIRKSALKCLHFVADPLRSFLSKTLLRFGLLKRLIVIKVDGGVCSQMHFYLIGRLFERRGCRVKFDTEFFSSGGYDMNRRFVRNFDLLKAFPSISFRQISKLERYLYREFEFANDYNDNTGSFKYLSLDPPRYLTGYYRNPPGFYDLFPQEFVVDYSVLDNANLNILKFIESKACPVSVHVRRGDLAVFNPYYGEPVDEHYLNNAIRYVEAISGTSCFYFIFSDEPEWVKENLIKSINVEDYHVVDINGSDRGYMDLILMSACHFHITSKGTLGKYGGFLSNFPNKKIIVYDDRYERMVWENQHTDIVFLN